MNKILHAINSEKELKDQDIKNIYDNLSKKLTTYLENGMNYSDIAKFVFDANSESMEYFYKNLNKVRLYANLEKNNDVKEYIDKVKNHVELETCRLNYIEKNQKEQLLSMMDSTLSEVKSMTQKIDSHDNKIEKYNREINNWYANIITILGLFSAIVVTFFGGLGAITSIFSNIHLSSKYRLIFIILIVIFAMFNIVFMLLYYVAKITDKSLTKDCSKNCKRILKSSTCNTEVKTRKSRDISFSASKECEHKILVCSAKRYPFVIYFNVCIILMMMALVFIYFTNK